MQVVKRKPRAFATASRIRSQCLSERRGFGCIAVFSAGPGNWPSRLSLSEGPCPPRAAQRPVNITQRLSVAALYALERILQRITGVMSGARVCLGHSSARTALRCWNARSAWPASHALPCGGRAAATSPRSPSSRGPLPRPPARLAQRGATAPRTLYVSTARRFNLAAIINDGLILSASKSLNLDHL